jgi:hypothetical protein
MYLCLAIGAGDALRTATVRMAKGARHAHLYEQLSYQMVNDRLLSATPRK